MNEWSFAGILDLTRAVNDSKSLERLAVLPLNHGLPLSRA